MLEYQLISNYKNYEAPSFLSILCVGYNFSN